MGAILASKIDVMVLVDAHAREYFTSRYQEAVSEQSSQLQVRAVDNGFTLGWEGSL